MTPSSESDFKKNYAKHLQHPKLKSIQSKTIDVYSREILRIVEYFILKINNL